MLETFKHAKFIFCKLKKCMPDSTFWFPDDLNTLRCIDMSCFNNPIYLHIAFLLGDMISLCFWFQGEKPSIFCNYCNNNNNNNSREETVFEKLISVQLPSNSLLTTC